MHKVQILPPFSTKRLNGMKTTTSHKRSSVEKVHQPTDQNVYPLHQTNNKKLTIVSHTISMRQSLLLATATNAGNIETFYWPLSLTTTTSNALLLNQMLAKKYVQVLQHQSTRAPEQLSSSNSKIQTIFCPITKHYYIFTSLPRYL